MQPQTLTMTSVNTTDATRGQLLGERVLARKAELEAALADLDAKETVAKEALETALATASELTTGDIEHPSETTASSMNKWLESNKHLAGGDVPKGGKGAPAKKQNDKQGDAPQDPGTVKNNGTQPKSDDDRDVDVSSLNDGDSRGSGPLPGDQDRLAELPGDKLQS